MTAILRLNIAGVPTAWLTREMAAIAYVKGLVRWELGEKSIVMHGGINASGVQSTLAMCPVIATEGDIFRVGWASYAFTNLMLFRRDNHRCMYCGHRFAANLLTRDHVQPSSRGGADVWENVVAACQRCNHFKADRTPEEAGMTLLAVPFRPNIYEAMFLARHGITDDQMDYLEKQFSGLRDWQAA